MCLQVSEVQCAVYDVCIMSVTDVFAGERYSGCKPGPKLVIHYTGLVCPPSEVWCERVTGHSALIVWSKGMSVCVYLVSVFFDALVSVLACLYMCLFVSVHVSLLVCWSVCLCISPFVIVLVTLV